MKYVVEIEIIVGGYEKSASVTVEADSEIDACYKALVSETHNTPLTYQEYHNGDLWVDDIFTYRIMNVGFPEQVRPDRRYLFKDEQHETDAIMALAKEYGILIGKNVFSLKGLRALYNFRASKKGAPTHKWKEVRCITE